MANKINTGTRDVPLALAARVTEAAETAWDDGSFLETVTPVTADLLRFWFAEEFTREREVNFHEGQRRAILNVVYCREVLGAWSVEELYRAFDVQGAGTDFWQLVCQEKYNHPMACVKLATGTGKTWVMHALMVWQYLNARAGDARFTKNFLAVAPGLIVYDRLQDAYLGKETADGTRDFATSDLKRFEGLFLPLKYRDAVLDFVQTRVVRKEEIARRVTGDGVIALTNWHLLSGTDEDEGGGEETLFPASPLDDPGVVVEELLPVTPGTTAGHDLNAMDSAFLGGGELEWLAGLQDICVFNDEAHHIHENKTAGTVREVEWQRALNRIAAGKGRAYAQIDFSATPYDVTGSGERRTKHYFPHVVVDFGLKEAVHRGLVKTITIDRRKELGSLENSELEFTAVREGRRAVALADGQRLMLRAGLAKLRKLEEAFTREDVGKHPKMLVICEDTQVSPLVAEFLVTDGGLGEEDVVRIDSDKKGEMKPDEWREAKRRLFNIDRAARPKVIVSVLMLREGFDVNNVCVIVPLRSSQAPILLEQVIGRGLRLMWRERVYDEVKAENRRRMFREKLGPQNYLDILSIVEHPAYLRFYEDLENDLVVEERDGAAGATPLGDVVTVGLRDGWERYDIAVPRIVADESETFGGDAEAFWAGVTMARLPFTLEQLRRYAGSDDADVFYSEEMTKKTTFGPYKVSSELFGADCYNAFLAGLVRAVTTNFTRGAGRGAFPVVQIGAATLAAALDRYVRRDLFGEAFDPTVGNEWRVLMVAKTGIVEHIMRETARAIEKLLARVKVEEAEVVETRFSSVPELKMRENFSVVIRKSIYARTAYPSNKGEFERAFLEAADADGEIEAVIKIYETAHTFAQMSYIRSDGMISRYFPDFAVRAAGRVWFVETKARKDLDNRDVRQKQMSALEWCGKINRLSAERRGGAEWAYALLPDGLFYGMRANGASVREILAFATLQHQQVQETLF